MRWAAVACLALLACSSKKHAPAETPRDAAPPVAHRPADAAAPAATPCDTDDGLAAWVARKRDTTPGPEPLRCVHRAQGFPGVILVGSVATDRGCKPSMVIVDCTLQNGPADALILNRAGWATANGHERAALALRYLRQVATVFMGTIADAPDPPHAEPTRDGNVVAEVWLDRAAGMRRGRFADKIRYTFRSDGAVTSEIIGHIDERH